MITRIAVIDPGPKLPEVSDVLVYQVPENSREFKLLTDLLDKAEIKWVEIKPDRPRRRKSSP